MKVEIFIAKCFDTFFSVIFNTTIKCTARCKANNMLIISRFICKNCFATKFEAFQN